MSKINTITVNPKVGAKVPEMVAKLTGAFMEVIANYCDESVASFTETVKVLRLSSKEVYNQIAGGEIATGLVGMMVKHDGNAIVKNHLVRIELKNIKALYDQGTEVPSAETLWMEIATLITFVPEEGMVVIDKEVENGEVLSEVDAEVEKEAEQLCSNNESNPEGDNEMSTVVETTFKVTEEIKEDTVVTPEQEAALVKATKDFAETLRQIDIDITADVKEFTDKVKAKVKGEQESTMLEKVALGAAVGVGAVVVTAGVYYAYKAIFGASDEMGDLI